MGFTLGSLFFPYYGLYIVLGLIIAALIGVFQIKRFKKDLNDFIIIAATAGLGGIIGAKMLYLIVSWRDIDLSRIADPAYLNSLMGGGFVFYGGLIGGALALLLCRKRLTADIVSYMDICIPCLPTVHGFGRLGCFAVGCCYGIPFDSAFSVVYHVSPFAPNEVNLFPVQLMEALCNFLIAAVLLVYIDVLRRKHGISLYALLYAPLRFFLEFLRRDEARGRLGSLSVSQWISLLIILSAISLFLFQKRRHSAPDFKNGTTASYQVQESKKGQK